jgi:hypothetical protein
MWLYEKKLQYPVRVCKKDLPMAKFLLTQFGGPNFRFCKKKISYFKDHICYFIIHCEMYRLKNTLHKIDLFL